MGLEKAKRSVLAVFGGSLLLTILMFYVLKLEVAIYVVYLPMDWIGDALRFLSLSSNIGNSVSVIFYVLLSLAPFGIFIFHRKRGDQSKADWLLVLLSGFDFFMFYCFVNPQELYKIWNGAVGYEDFLPYQKLGLSLIFYSIVISYLIISLLFKVDRGRIRSPWESEFKKMNLFLWLRRILTAYLIFYMIVIFYFGSFQLLKQMTELFKSQGDVDIVLQQFTQNTEVAGVYSIAEFLCNLIPIGFMIVLVFYGIELLDRMEEDRYSAEVIRLTEKIGRMGRYTVYATVSCNLVTNLAQLCLGNWLLDINIWLVLPFGPLIIAFAALILAKYFKESAALYEDEQMII